MSKGKIFLIVGILILIAGLPLGIFILSQKTSFSLRAQVENKPENVQVINITEKEATIQWTTKRATQGAISYGLSPTNLTLIQPENAPAINHQVKISNLLPENNYFFVIKIGQETFDNNGQPFTFTTKKNTPPPTPTPYPTFTPTPTPFSNNVPTPTFSPNEPSPTTNSSTLTEEGFQSALGTNNPLYDLNKDGVVNVQDIFLFRNQQNK